MPTRKIQVFEYECVFCRYKWINRINGKDGLVPQRCARCKRYYWNDGRHVGKSDPITPNERGLRVKLYRFEGYDSSNGSGNPSYKPNELCKKFLSVNPRPTIEELDKAMNPLGISWDIHKHRFRKLVPEVRENVRPPFEKAYYLRGAGYVREDPKGHERLLKEETLKRREYMKQIIDSRT